MMLGVVVGSVWSTKKAQALTGQPLLLVSPQSRSGPPIVAVDCVGAGEGETVLVASGGAAPLYFYTNPYMMKTNVKNVIMLATGDVIWNYAYLK